MFGLFYCTQFITNDLLFSKERTYMDIMHYKKMLLNKQQELLNNESTNNEAANVVELDQSKVGRLSRMDALQAQAMSLETKRRRQLELTKIKSALLRIGNDEYGYCLRCDNEISEKRLEIDPAATLCITCASQQEQ